MEQRMSSKELPFEVTKEIKIGKTTYEVTSVYLNEISLSEAIEELAVRKAIAETKGNS